MTETEIQTRGNVAPGKVQVNWRIDERSFNKAKVVAPEQGFSSVPALVNFILNKALFDENIFSILFKGGR